MLYLIVYVVRLFVLLFSGLALIFGLLTRLPWWLLQQIGTALSAGISVFQFVKQYFGKYNWFGRKK